MFKYFKDGVTVLCVLDRRRVKLSGLYPVKVEVVFRRRQKLFSSGVDMSEEEWKSFFSMRDITFKQQKLRKRFDSIVECVDKLCFSENFSIESLVGMLGGKAEITLNRYMESVSETFLEAGKVNSYYRCRSTLRNIEKFAGKSVYFSDINIEWLRACERFWFEDGKNRTTVCIYMKTLKSIMNRALDDGYLNGNLPYGRRGYLIPQGSVRKMALTKDQIKRLMDFTGDSKLEKYRDLWLFSYLCNGINFKDMLLLKHRNVENGEICFIRSKTESAYRISKTVRAVVTPEMSDIITRWGNPVESGPDSYIFPYANGIEGDIAIANMVRKVICQCNMTLGQIAERLDIPKFTTYSARHSFATILMKSGVSIKFISESLGHSSLSVTENYLAGFDYEERRRNASFLTDL